MPRLAYRRSALRFLTLTAGLALASRPAAASDPLTTFCLPRQVELLPNADTATRVVIHGSFFQLTSTTAFTYSTPKCGVMYFECAAGQEAMCRMQWKELRDWDLDPLHKPYCAGFGSRSVVGAAAVRVEGEPLGTPDKWDLGMGVGWGAWVDGKCEMAKTLACVAPASDGGAAPDPIVDGASSMPEAPVGASDSGSTSPPLPPASTDDAGAPPVTVPPAPDGGRGDDAQTHQLSGNRGCTLVGSAGSELMPVAFGLCAVALARRRRRA
jgi:hypothetical protein